MSVNLYTAADVAKIRVQLLEEQKGLDALTGLPITLKESVTDHNHSTQYVRGVLHRQSNAVLGKIENLWHRYLGWWYNGSLSDFLRQSADYLEKPDNTNYVHPAWIKRVTIDFSKLPAGIQNKVLAELETKHGSNAIERKKLFNKALLSRKYSYETIKEILKG